ncbi:AimR family lysis-lysogeny pheromone receptor [Bacillus massiliigorillae]|uniref:AimR family lysis-lysogeny pheromone receptor n=1 Tax=Bacillus massiliigorillae TaxID=1243664 RepID=UPI00039AF6BA|nr:AimR family lysis-lysogeny pheromone receptor [Bacillus massiliigorillae]
MKFFEKITETNNTISLLKKKYSLNYTKQKRIIKSMYHIYADYINIPVLLEFYHMEGDSDELSALIEKLKKSEDKNIQTWASLYYLLIRHHTDTITPQDLINQTLTIPTTTKEMKVFSLLLFLYGVYCLRLYDHFNTLSKHVLLLIKQIDNDYLRNAYRFQLLLLCSASYLMINKVSISRELCKDIFKEELQTYYPLTHSQLYHVMGASYTFTNYQDTLYWLNKACENLLTLSTSCVKFHLQKQQSTLYFVENIWQTNIHYIPPDPSEAAHRLIIMNRKQEAINILNHLHKQTGELSPFQEFYYASATQDIARLQMARKKFLSESNYYFLHLFQKENLNKYGFT